MRTGSHRKRVYFINNVTADRVSWKKISRAYRRKRTANFERTANGTEIQVCLLVQEVIIY